MEEWRRGSPLTIQRSPRARERTCPTRSRRKGLELARFKPDGPPIGGVVLVGRAATHPPITNESRRIPPPPPLTSIQEVSVELGELHNPSAAAPTPGRSFQKRPLGSFRRRYRGIHAVARPIPTGSRRRLQCRYLRELIAGAWKCWVYSDYELGVI